MNFIRNECNAKPKPRAEPKGYCLSIAELLHKITESKFFRQNSLKFRNKVLNLLQNDNSKFHKQPCKTRHVWNEHEHHYTKGHDYLRVPYTI